MNVRRILAAFILGYLVAITLFFAVTTAFGYPEFGIVGGLELATIALGFVFSILWYTKDDLARVLGRKYAARFR